jgi:BirA family biotin operon repressor/biotin-[acetyl-CoA-carboxylase] ligase
MRTSPYADLSRPPLRQETLRRALVRPGGLWSAIRVVRETGSTNADLAAAARAGGAEGSILIAEAQLAGRGRLNRPWVAPPQSAITVSLLLRPGDRVPAARLGWLPLLVGVALAEAVGRLAVVDAVLKWPNDLLIRSSLSGEADYRKCGGVLAEIVGDAVVVGIGLNVAQRADELPEGGYPATSLAIAAAACTDRDPLVRAILRGLERWYERWTAARGDPDPSGLRAAYVERCETLGRDVAVALPTGDVLRGSAAGIDSDGRLTVDTAAGMRLVAAGDVLRVR